MTNELNTNDQLKIILRNWLIGICLEIKSIRLIRNLPDYFFAQSMQRVTKGLVESLSVSIILLQLLQKP